MKKFVKILSLILAISFVFVLSGCGNKLKIKDVDSITLSCPSDDDEDGKSVILTSNMHSSDFYEIIELCQGEILDSIEEGPFFGLAKITFTKTDGNTYTIYPACDGSSYLCLDSLNDMLASYVKLEDSTMARLTAILKKHDITLS
ncbi:MAG: hypothetical protein IKT35_00655 [Clostridia bacterium]|nr:hypothetical protein [Clostridia bacterium]